MMTPLSIKPSDQVRKAADTEASSSHALVNLTRLIRSLDNVDPEDSDASNGRILPAEIALRRDWEVRQWAARRHGKLKFIRLSSTPGSYSTPSESRTSSTSPSTSSMRSQVRNRAFQIFKDIEHVVDPRSDPEQRRRAIHRRPILPAYHCERNRLWCPNPVPRPTATFTSTCSCLSSHLTYGLHTDS